MTGVTSPRVARRGRSRANRGGSAASRIVVADRRLRIEGVAEAVPDLAERCARRLLDPGLVLLGTLRVDGAPRISPVESLVVDGELELGMMAGSLKARDLLRDPCCVVHLFAIDVAQLGWMRIEEGKMHLASSRGSPWPDRRSRGWLDWIRSGP